MRNKQRLAMGLFFLLGLSTLIFGTIVMYQTYDLDHLEGRTVVMGYVYDTDENPIQGVKVNSSDREVISDENGYWELNGVKQGYINIQFYKPGYVLYSLKWLAYPQEDLADIEKSPNNISYAFSSSGYDIQLSRELEEIQIGEYENGTISLTISSDVIQNSNISTVYFSSNLSSFDSSQISSGPVNIDIEGDGTYYIGLEEKGPYLRGFHPVNSVINISNGISSLKTMKKNISHDVEHGHIAISVDQNELIGEVEFFLLDNLTGSRLDAIHPIDPNNFTISVDPGVYDLEMTGETIRDRVFRTIIVNSSGNEVIETKLIEADMEKDLDLSLTGNYFIAAAYLGIALILFYAALYMKNGGSWAVLLILAFVGFLSQGFQIFTFNINSLIAVVLLVVLFSIRSEYNRKRQRILDQRGARKL